MRFEKVMWHGSQPLTTVFPLSSKYRLTFAMSLFHSMVATRTWVNGATLNGASSSQMRHRLASHEAPMKVIVSLWSTGRVAHRTTSREMMKA